MTRISKAVKDQNPEVYGYGNPNLIPGNEDGVIRTYYMSFQDYDGDIRYCAVSKELYEMDRNERRKEQQRKDRRSRCIIPSEKYGLKICDHNCDECPFHLDKRVPSEESMDYMYDNYDYEYTDDSESVVEIAIKEERMHALEVAVSKLPEGDQVIVKLYSEGADDGMIAEKVGSKRSTIQYRRQRIFDSLREQLKDF